VISALHLLWIVPVAACVGNAKLQVEMAHILLCNGAQRAKQIIADFKPVFASKEEYFAYTDQLNCSGERIKYTEDGLAMIKA